MIAVASKLLTNCGEVVDVARPNVLFVDPTTGIATEASPTNFTGYGHPSLYDVEYIDNVNILHTDIRLLFYSTTTPLVGDVFTVDATEYNTISVQQIRAQGSNIYYIVQLRQ